MINENSQYGVKAMIAVGEAGLPYYMRQKKKVDLAPYIELLELFIQKASDVYKIIWDNTCRFYQLPDIG
ncbi:Tat protein secretion system quality control protein TatD with DNase activity [Scopulibacillus daqui]|uniref:Tat protein secretion system quality control protein TatD with DNase activity n=1 Tax=Scopulibacillus daqui TaxID=1469162 RepID=A0ABS2PZU3_9BACL|nr:hypothetical protein [Scopulibacillus daqui]MBM7645235.1 Tat protein secretion system quality control protein TatD with DNase activity [Scopulibacillus daqui]